MTRNMLKSKKEHGMLFRDDVHLSADGGKLVARLLLKAIAQCTKGYENQSMEMACTNLDSFSSTKDHISRKDTCFTALGPPENRNLASVAAAPAWPFVEQAHRSAPNGKNGYETNIDGDCMDFTINASCHSRVYLFYLSSADVNMGKAAVSVGNCTSDVQLVDAHNPHGLSITSLVELQAFSDDACCEVELTPVKVSVCACAGDQGARFRVVGLGLSEVE